MSTNIERWASVELKGLTWIVSDHGRVKAPAQTTTFCRAAAPGVVLTATRKERLVCQHMERSTGYLRVAVMHAGKRTKEYVHRLVAKAFVPGFDESLSVNHIDGDKTRNVPRNLEWVTLGRNTQHQWESGLLPNGRGEAHHQAKLTAAAVREIRRQLAQGVRPSVLARVAGVDIKIITRIRDGSLWKTVTSGRPVKP